MEMVPQTLEARYIDKGDLTRLLQQLFGQNFTLEASQSFLEAEGRIFLTPFIQVFEEYYNLIVPRKLTKVSNYRMTNSKTDYT
jgi:hypothetical protein